MAIPEVTNNIITPLAKPVRRPPREIATLIPFARNDRIGIGVAGSVSDVASPEVPNQFNPTMEIALHTNGGQAAFIPFARKDS